MFFLEFVFPFIVGIAFLFKSSYFALITFCKKKTSLNNVLFKSLKQLLFKVILKQFVTLHYQDLALKKNVIYDKIPKFENLKKTKP